MGENDSHYRRAAVAAVIALALAGCGDGEGGERPRVVATTTQVADIARAVAGPDAAVDGLLPPNADPHSFEPRPSDAAALADARLVVRSGGEVDAWLGGVLDAAGGHADVLTLLDVVEPGVGDPDPHWWHDPRLGLRAVDAIRAALARADPAHADGYRRRASAYAERVRAADREAEGCLRRVPAPQRTIVTTHDALAAFARRYGYRIVGSVLPARTTRAQPSAGETAALVRRLRAEHVRAVFPETSLDPRLERAIAREAGAAVGRPLYADALGPRGSDGSTYLASLRYNAAAIAEGVSGGAVRCR